MAASRPPNVLARIPDRSAGDVDGLGDSLRHQNIGLAQTMTINTYKLSELEQKNIAEFREDHDPPFFRFGRCGKYEVTFSHESGIGIGVKVKCSCGARRDVTDYSRW